MAAGSLRGSREMWAGVINFSMVVSWRVLLAFVHDIDESQSQGRIANNGQSRELKESRGLKDILSW